MLKNLVKGKRNRRQGFRTSVILCFQSILQGKGFGTHFGRHCCRLSISKYTGKCDSDLHKCKVSHQAPEKDKLDSKEWTEGGLGWYGGKEWTEFRTALASKPRLFPNCLLLHKPGLGWPTIIPSARRLSFTILCPSIKKLARAWQTAKKWRFTLFTLLWQAVFSTCCHTTKESGIVHFPGTDLSPPSLDLSSRIRICPQKHCQSRGHIWWCESSLPGLSNARISPDYDLTSC